MRLFLTIFIAVAILLLGCGAAIYSTQLQPHKAMRMNQCKVEIDIFSGRPNPTWKLSQEDAQLLAVMLQQLTPTKPQGFFDGLGYRGFVVTSRKPLAGATTIRVYKGNIKFGTGDVATYYVDPNQQLEKWLLSKARAVLNNEEYKVIANEIAP